MSDQYPIYNKPDDDSGMITVGRLQRSDIPLNQDAVNRWGESRNVEYRMNPEDDPTLQAMDTFSRNNPNAPEAGDPRYFNSDLYNQAVDFTRTSDAGDWSAPAGSLPAQAGVNDIEGAIGQPITTTTNDNTATAADVNSDPSMMGDANSFAKGGRVQPWTRPAVRAVYPHAQLPGVTIDRRHNVPEGARMHTDGKTALVDRRLPRIVKVNGKPLDPAYPHVVRAYIQHHLSKDPEFSKAYADGHTVAGDDIEQFWLKHHGYDHNAYNKMFKRQPGLVAGGEAPAFDDGGSVDDDEGDEGDEAPQDQDNVQEDEDITGSAQPRAAAPRSGSGDVNSMMLSDLVEGGAGAHRKTGLWDAIKQALVRSAIPSAAAYSGFSAGAALGAPTAPFTAGLGPVATGLVGAYLASKYAGQAQEPLMDQLGFSADQYAAAQQEHPYATLATEIGTNAPFTGVGGVGRVARAVGGALGLATEGAQQYNKGEFDPTRLAIATAGQAALGARRNKFNDAFDIAGGVEGLHNYGEAQANASAQIRNRLGGQPGFPGRPAASSEFEAGQRDQAVASTPATSDSKGVASERTNINPDPDQSQGGRRFSEIQEGRQPGYDVTRSDRNGSKFAAPQSDIAQLRVDAVSKGDPASTFSSTTSQLNREFPPIQNPNEVAPDQAAALIRQSRFRPPAEEAPAPDMSGAQQPDERFLGQTESGAPPGPVPQRQPQIYREGAQSPYPPFGKRGGPQAEQPLAQTPGERTSTVGGAEEPQQTEPTVGQFAPAGEGARTPVMKTPRTAPATGDQQLSAAANRRAGESMYPVSAGRTFGRRPRVQMPNEAQDAERNFVTRGYPREERQLAQGRTPPERLAGPPEMLGLPAPGGEPIPRGGEPTQPRGGELTSPPASEAVPPSDKGASSTPGQQERLVSPEEQAVELAGEGAEKPTKVVTVTADNLRSPEVRQALMERGVSSDDAKSMSLYKAKQAIAEPALSETPAPKGEKENANVIDSFIKNQSGEGKIHEALSNFYDRFMPKAYPTGYGYRAKSPRSEQARQAMDYEESLHKLRQEDVSDKQSLQTLIDSMPGTVRTPNAGERMYTAFDEGKVASLPGHMQSAISKFIQPLAEEAKQLYANIKKIDPAMLPDGFLSRIAKGHSVYDRLGGEGGDDPITGQTLNLKTRPLNERSFMAAVRDDGQRSVISKVDGGLTQWDKYEGTRVDAPGLDMKPGETFTHDGHEYTIDQAKTSEIEKNALFSNGKPAEYHKNLTVSMVDTVLGLRSVARHLQFLENLKQDPNFLANSTKDLSVARSNGWRESEMPQMKGIYMDPRLADVFDSYYRPGFSTDNLNMVRRLSSAITKSIFLTPIPHAANVFWHWWVGRGWDWVKPQAYHDLVTTGSQAIKSVLTQDALQDRLRSAGAGTVYGSTLTQDARIRMARSAGMEVGTDNGPISREFVNQWLNSLGTEIKANPARWDPIARTLGVGPSDLFHAVYRASSKMMWGFNDILLTQQILANEKAGMSTEQAIQHAERHIPNYRMPSRVLGSDAGGRFMSQAMSDPATMVFGRYHYGVYNSLAHMAKGLAVGSGPERLEAAGNVFALGLFLLAAKPLLDVAAQNITGNKSAETMPRGPAAPISHLTKMAQGKEGPEGFVGGTLTLPPYLQTLLQAASNRDWTGKDIIEKGDLARAGSGDVNAMGRVAVQEGQHLAGSFAPLGTATRAYQGGKNPLTAFRDQMLLDVRNPSAKAQAYAKKQPAINEAAAKKRYAKPRGPIEGGYNAVFGRPVHQMMLSDLVK